MCIIYVSYVHMYVYVYLYACRYDQVDAQIKPQSKNIQGPKKSRVSDVTISTPMVTASPSCVWILSL